MNFRFYTNENFPQFMIQLLREKGYDLLTSQEAGQANQGISDRAVLAFAVEYNRIIITLNRDDFIQLHRQNQQHCGIIICKTDRDYQGQINFLHHYLQTQTSLENRLIRIKKQNQPKFSQPQFIVQEY
jgi:predicted nuclease of predicted toxin-antitoxin system